MNQMFGLDAILLPALDFLPVEVIRRKN